MEKPILLEVIYKFVDGKADDDCYWDNRSAQQFCNVQGMEILKSVSFFFILQERRNIR